MSWWGSLEVKFFFVFSRFLQLLVKNQKKTREKKTRENQKKQTPQTMWGQGVATCFFCFLEVFATFGQKQKKLHRRAIVSRALVLLCVFVFWRFLPLLVKSKKKLEKTQKKNSTDYVGPRGSHRAIVSRVLVLLCVFLFSRGFLWFLVKKKQKKIEKTFLKKQDPTDYLGPRGSHRAMVSRVLFFFVLLLFSRSFWSFWCPLLFCGGGFVVWRCS